ncbi:hypothetical protein M422DRAFT_47650 [Sphaerobolus stellatus SS14]|uniref:Uncharacterized protein n=1 Tax=Sphaerobolus stellatus (strain SS14) TaxID=990650 RepID=A0A0C9V9Z0_SPHS4|nr:hypothetical protein M422DRAFT_47650 [Sphaerobolus stellatus SS14]
MAQTFMFTYPEPEKEKTASKYIDVYSHVFYWLKTLSLTEDLFNLAYWSTYSVDSKSGFLGYLCQASDTYCQLWLVNGPEDRFVQAFENKLRRICIICAGVALIQFRYGVPSPRVCITNTSLPMWLKTRIPADEDPGLASDILACFVHELTKKSQESALWLTGDDDNDDEPPTGMIIREHAGLEMVIGEQEQDGGIFWWCVGTIDVRRLVGMRGYHGFLMMMERLMERSLSHQEKTGMDVILIKRIRVVEMDSSEVLVAVDGEARVG